MKIKKVTFLSFYDLTVRCPKAMQHVTTAIERLSAALSRCACAPDEMYIDIPDALKAGETEVTITLHVSSRYTYPPTCEYLYNTQMDFSVPRWHVSITHDTVRAGIYNRPLAEFAELTTDEMVARMVELWIEKLPKEHAPMEVST